MIREDDFPHIRAAVEAARLSISETGPPRPKVGSVVVVDGKVLATAYRGELSRRHAEVIALEDKLPDVSVVGGVVYTTLEPCVRRGPGKVPCAERLIERRVSRVVIGMVDPDPDISGKGILALREAGIEVDLFPGQLMSEVEAINREFIRRFPSARRQAPKPSAFDPHRPRPLDEWYKTVNSIYFQRNYQRDSESVLAHLVEAVGGLSLLASGKSKAGVPAEAYFPKAVGWWLALCGRVGVASVETMLWAKFPGVCPYCQRRPHNQAVCSAHKKKPDQPDWAALRSKGQATATSRPRNLVEWQRMWGDIYPVSDTEDYSRTFARFSEELGELAEAVRVFRVAPGYFMSEASDVLAWLMHLRNLYEAKLHEKGEAPVQDLEAALGTAYPGLCVSCGHTVCVCPAVLPSTLGRIAHEMKIAPDDQAFFMDPIATAISFKAGNGT